VSDKNTLFSPLWRNPRCRRGLFIAGLGILFFFLGGADLLDDPADEFALWTVYVGGLFFLAGVALALIAWRREMRKHALSSAAPAGRGRVLSVKKDWLSRAYVLHYRFNDSGGRIHRGKKILSQQEAFTWREGEEGEIRYDSKDPKTSIWIGRAVEFEADGGSATAPAILIEVTPQKADGDKGTRVRYRYRDHLGETHEDQFIDDEGAPYAVGEAGIVAFDPRHPGLNQWLGKSDAVSALGGMVEAKSRPQRAAAPLPIRASRPSTFRLAGRSKPLKNARLLLFYIFIAALFLLLLIAVEEPVSSRNDLLGFTLFSMLLLALVVWFVLSLRKGIREVKGWRRILDRGSAAGGTVSLVEEKHQSLGRWTWQPGWVSTYRYHDHEGKPHTGDGYLSRREAQPWRSGDDCVVVYDPAQPSSSVWVGKA
jgi:hypothetical protein